MQVVGARARGERELSTGKTAMLGGVGSGGGAEFFQGIHRDQTLGGAESGFTWSAARITSAPTWRRRISSRIRADAIHHEVVGFGAVSVHAHGSTLPLTASRNDDRDTWGKREKRLETASVQWHVFHELTIDQGADRGIEGIEVDAATLYHDGVGDITDFHGDVDSDGLRGLQDNACAFKAFEALDIDAQYIPARQDGGKVVKAFSICLGFQDGVGTLRSQLEFGIRHHSAGGIYDASADRCILRMNGRN